MSRKEFEFKSAGETVNLRITPELVFELDDSMVYGERIVIGAERTLVGYMTLIPNHLFQRIHSRT